MCDSTYLIFMEDHLPVYQLIPHILIEGLVDFARFWELIHG